MPLLRNTTPVGVGATVKVFTAFVEHTMVAIKVFSIAASQFACEKGKGGAVHPLSICLTELKRELVLSTALADHPNILHMLDFAAEPLCLILEFCSGGDLFHFLHTPTPSSSGLVSSFATEIYRAIVSPAQGPPPPPRELRHHPHVSADGLLFCVFSDLDLSACLSNEPIDNDN